jgi:hypothetical protein
MSHLSTSCGSQPRLTLALALAFTPPPPCPRLYTDQTRLDIPLFFLAIGRRHEWAFDQRI